MAEVAGMGEINISMRWRITTATVEKLKAHYLRIKLLL